MSYNGVGLQSVRGSGTSGYVQRNLSVPKPQRRYDLMRDQVMAPEPVYKKPNADIMQHAAKRAVELKLMELRLVMEEQGYGEKEIFDKIAEARATLVDAGAPLDMSAPSAAATGTHGLSALKHAEDERLRGAFGISREYKEGSSFDVEAQAQRKAEAQVAREVANAKWEAEVAARTAARTAREANRTARDSEPRIRVALPAAGSRSDPSHAHESVAAPRRRDWSRSRSPRPVKLRGGGTDPSARSRPSSPLHSRSPLHDGAAAASESLRHSHKSRTSARSRSSSFSRTSSTASGSRDRSHSASHNK